MVKEELIIENARVIFRNFSGIQTDKNREGERNFNVVIDDAETAIELREKGWNIKELTDRDDPNKITYHLPVKINLDSKWPPKIYTYTPNKVLTLIKDDEMINDLDQADIAFVDVKINPYYWENNGKSGVSAYLKELYVNLEEDRLYSKYAQREHPREDYDEVIHPDEMPLS